MMLCGLWSVAHEHLLIWKSDFIWPILYPPWLCPPVPHSPSLVAEVGEKVDLLRTTKHRIFLNNSGGVDSMWELDVTTYALNESIKCCNYEWGSLPR